MHKYSELTNVQNILVELYDGGAIDTETVAALLNLAQPTASNLLRRLYGQGYLTRKDIYKHEKLGGRRFQYDLTSQGKRKVIWIKTRILQSA